MLCPEKFSHKESGLDDFYTHISISQSLRNLLFIVIHYYIQSSNTIKEILIAVTYKILLYKSFSLRKRERK